jgi:hypothetical protein
MITAQSMGFISPQQIPESPCSQGKKSDDDVSFENLGSNNTALNEASAPINNDEGDELHQAGEAGVTQNIENDDPSKLEAVKNADTKQETVFEKTIRIGLSIFALIQNIYTQISELIKFSVKWLADFALVNIHLIKECKLSTSLFTFNMNIVNHNHYHGVQATQH